MGKLFISEHPLVQHKMSMLRNKDTKTKEFKELIREVAILLTYEATRELPLEEIEIETPIDKCVCKTITKRIDIVAILRAGIGMSDAVSEVLPTSKIGHIGLYRDPETLNPIEYYCKLPSGMEESEVFLVDPMIATGKTASASISFLKERGAKKITMLSILAAPDGVKTIQSEHEDVDIYVAGYDTKLNEHGYIVPGLGDAGDRIFGTK
ncbi:MAG: uracil phosphoribosyltransferase [Firmicutes bacterium]|nr:uracil phosphoribosyltransferase [Bacillota bacterium]